MYRNSYCKNYLNKFFVFHLIIIKGKNQLTRTQDLQLTFYCFSQFIKHTYTGRVRSFFSLVGSVTLLLSLQKTLREKTIEHRSARVLFVPLIPTNHSRALPVVPLWALIIKNGCLPPARISFCYLINKRIKYSAFGSLLQFTI